MILAKKKYGQNFLIDNNILDKLVKLSKVDNNYIIEIGPGTGKLTRKLLNKPIKSLLAFEIDLDMVELLYDLKKDERFRLVHQDFLKIDLNSYLDKDKNYEVVANLPYYISSKIIFSLLKQKNILSLNIMLQQELVDRIVSKPSTKAYGRFSVAINSFFTPNGTIFVTRNVFRPVPNVDSEFIRLEKQKLFTTRIDDYLEYIKLVFSSKRKTLLNNLRKTPLFYDLTKEYFINNKFKLDIRAEAITVTQFQNL